MFFFTAHLFRRVFFTGFPRLLSHTFTRTAAATGLPWSHCMQQVATDSPKSRYRFNLCLAFSGSIYIYYIFIWKIWKNMFGNSPTEFKGYFWSRFRVHETHLKILKVGSLALVPNEATQDQRKGARLSVPFPMGQSGYLVGWAYLKHILN